jgi:DNA-binding XRE family transcriptional regulator
MSYTKLLYHVVFRTKHGKNTISEQHEKELREELQMPQRKLAAVLDIDTATYCKIEKGERRARKEHISIIAELLQADYEELLKLWLADQVTAVVADEKELSNDVLKIAKKNLNK